MFGPWMAASEGGHDVKGEDSRLISIVVGLVVLALRGTIDDDGAGREIDVRHPLIFKRDEFCR